MGMLSTFPVQLFLLKALSKYVNECQREKPQEKAKRGCKACQPCSLFETILKAATTNKTSLRHGEGVGGWVELLGKVWVGCFAGDLGPLSRLRRKKPQIVCPISDRK